jgi:glycosyltransferase involved in cell wall biosynthesis
MSEPVSVSVVIAAYNAARWLPATLASILAQDHRPLEVLVIDDGSPDDTQAVVASIADPRVRYARLPHSGGPSGPRNAGIRQATGEHLFIFDSDDLMRPGKIRDAVALLQAEPRVGLVFTDFVRIDEHGTELPGRFLDGYGHFRALPKRRVGDGMFVIEGRTAYEGLVWENYIGTSSVALRRSVLREVGLFDESLTNCEDRDLWFRVARGHDLGFIDRVGHAYRVHQGSILSGSAERLAPNRIEVLQRQLRQPLSRAAGRTAHRRIAENYRDLGYECRTRGRVGLARRHYLRGLRHRPSWRLLGELLWTWVGDKP